MILAANHLQLSNGNKKMNKVLIFIGLLLMSAHMQAQGDTNHLEVSLILPFSAKSVYENPKDKNAAVSEACRQYFEGFTIAIDSLEKLGIPVNLRVFDTKLDTFTFKKILEKKEVQNSDLVFGPVMRNGTLMMKEFASKYKVFHVSPLMTLTKTSINDSFLVSAYPDLKFYANFILEAIKQQDSVQANIVILSDKKTNDIIFSKQFFVLKNKYKSFLIKNIDISKYLDYGLYYKMGANNHVVIACENEFLVTNVIKHLSDSSQFLNIHSWTTRKILEFNSVNLLQWEAINLNIISPFYVDYTDTIVKSFSEKYRERYYTEPSEFAVNGFEQAIYFISAYNQLHGEFWKLNEMQPKRILSNCFKIAYKEDFKSQQNVGLNQLKIENNGIKQLLKNTPKQQEQ